MGTDIHGFWELKHKSGNWIAVRQINKIRNYVWFGIIADVRIRNDGFQADHHHRGIPDDSSQAWLDYAKPGYPDWDMWLHDCTWLTISEVVECNKRFKKNRYFSYDAVDPEREPILKANEVLKRVWFSYDVMSPQDTSILWPEKVSDFIGSDKLDDTNARIVVGFDS